MSNIQTLNFDLNSSQTTQAQTGAESSNSDFVAYVVHNADEEYTDTLPDEVTTAEPFNIQTILIGAWKSNIYKAQILTGINTTDRTIKQYQRTTADNGSNWSAWKTL